jgi:hypothetical protein
MFDSTRLVANTMEEFVLSYHCSHYFYEATILLLDMERRHEE